MAGLLGRAPFRAPLAAAAALGLPDAWIAAGFVRSAAWDAASGLPPGTNPPGDIDVVWHNPAHADPALDAALEARLRAALPGLPWSVANQARMHARHGDPPYGSTAGAMAHWPETATAVGARLGPDGRVELLAPLGLEDLLGMVLRPGPAALRDPARMAAFRRRAAEKGWARRWPALRRLDL